MDMATLQQWMDFYNKNKMGPQDLSSHNGFNPTSFDRQGMAADWARGMMDDQQHGPAMPDYFGGSGAKLPDFNAGYQGAPYTGTPAKPMPMQPQVQNFLSQFMARK